MTRPRPAFWPTALLLLGLSSAAGIWLLARRDGPGATALVPRATSEAPAMLALDLREGAPVDAAERAPSLAPHSARLPRTDPGEPDPDPATPIELDPRSAKERHYYAHFVKLAGAEQGALEASAAEVLAGEGPRARKLAYLRVLRDSGSAEWVRWTEHAVRTFPESSDARGESVSHFGLRQLGLAASRSNEARAALERLAFESAELHPRLRSEAARSYAEHCELEALGDLCRRLRTESDRSVVAAALASLDARAAEPDVRAWLSLFEGHPRPVPTERDAERADG